MNVIEELFKKSESGTLTYDEFKKLADGMKFADISKGEYVAKAKYDDEIKGLNSQIETLNGTITTRDTDLAELKKQLETAGNDASKLAKLNTDLADLQTKYDNEVKDYQAKLQAQKYEFAVNNYANTKKFTSAAAKRDFIRSLSDKKLSMEGDTIVGVEDFTNKYSTDNADAFVVEKQPDSQDDKKLPQFASSTQGNPNQDKKQTNSFGFNFPSVR